MHTKTLHTTIHTHRQAHICIYTQVHRIFNWFRIDAVNHEGNMHTTKHTRTQAQTHTRTHAHIPLYLRLYAYTYASLCACAATERWLNPRQ